MEGLGCLYLIFAVFFGLFLSAFMSSGIPVMGLLCAFIILYKDRWTALSLAIVSVCALILLDAGKSVQPLPKEWPLGILYYLQLMITAILMVFTHYKYRDHGRQFDFVGVIALFCGAAAFVANVMFYLLWLPAFIHDYFFM